MGVIRTPGYENYIFQPLIFRGDVSFGGSDIENENGVINVNLPKRQNNANSILTQRKSKWPYLHLYDFLHVVTNFSHPRKWFRFNSSNLKKKRFLGRDEAN